jgi:hypothetical protein
MNTLPNQTAQAPGSVLSWVEGIESFGAPPEDPPVAIPAPRTLADLVQAYNEALAEFEQAAAERDQLNTALLDAQTSQRSVAASLKGLHEDWQDALLGEQEPSAKAALTQARAALVDLNELVNALNARKGRLSFDDSAAANHIWAARNEVMEHLSALEMKAFPAQALAALHAAYSVQSNVPWDEFLTQRLAAPADKGAVQLAVLEKHRVVLA